MKKLLLIGLLFLFIPLYVQAKGYEIISGDLDTVGSEVKIADEEFYVIRKEDETHVRLLAKLSLGIGEGVTNQINKQSTESGLFEFSSTKYWWDEENKDFKSPYLENKIVLNRENMDDKTYIYDENSTLYPYINEYSNYLNSEGVCTTAELMRREDVFALGCNDACVRCHGFTYFCYPDPIEWLYGDYWIGDAPIYQFHETTDPWETAPAYFSTGTHYFFSRAPVARVALDDYLPKHTIRPVVILDINNTCIEEEEEEEEDIVEEVEEQNYENPPTGAFLPIILFILLIIISIFTIIYFKKKELFKKL